MSSSQTYNPKHLKTVETADAFVHLRKDGLVHVHFKKNTVLSLKLQIDLRKIYAELLKENATGFVYSADEGFSISKEARENFGKLPQGNPILAYGIVANNLAYRLVANFFLKVYSPKIPLKLFDTVEEAAQWLHAKAYVGKP